MNFAQFKDRFSDLSYIPGRFAMASVENRQVVRNQLTRWQKKGLLIQLKRGVYVLNKNDRKVNPSRFFFANQLLWPSYVSLESALGHYGLIPEAVVDVTSVTSKKTSRFKNPLGEFIFQRIKPAAFRGFRSYKDEAGLDVFIAEPEKAVVDFLYLNLRKFKTGARSVFEESYRFQNTELLNPRKVLLWARLFENRRLVTVAGDFCDFIKGEKV